MNDWIDLGPRLLLTAAAIALLPLSWVWLRQRGADRRARIVALTSLTLFFTFDLIVFGAFTRLTDSGLGCPDWPGCYGHASPIGARSDISVAQDAMPSGPVTHEKAWIEMIHRYLAMTVGALIVVLALASWFERRRWPRVLPWALASLVWVVVQGLFGKYTVTLKLYPAIVTLHLLGGMALLMLLAMQREALQAQPLAIRRPPVRLIWLAVVVVLVQIALGGWVSTNYAVLACSGFPACSGSWVPPAAYQTGFTLLRDLGHTDDGVLLPFEALVAIHWVHRLAAAVVVLVLAALVFALWRAAQPDARRLAVWIAAMLVVQVTTGVSNVVLEWPLVAALVHTGGAAALVLTLTLLLARTREQAVPTVERIRPTSRAA